LDAPSSLIADTIYESLWRDNGFYKGEFWLIKFFPDTTQRNIAAVENCTEHLFMSQKANSYGMESSPFKLTLSAIVGGNSDYLSSHGAGVRN